MNTESQAISFLHFIAPKKKICIIYHADADGICAGVLLFKYIYAAKQTRAVAIPLQRGTNPFSKETQITIDNIRPHYVIVVDSGSREGSFPDNAKSMIIDHHVPDAIPIVDVFHNTVLDKTERIASEAVYDVVHKLRPDLKLEWYALIGITGDAGLENIPERFEIYTKEYGKKNVRDCVSLINAVRRHQSFRVEEVFLLLLQARSPSGFIELAEENGFRKLQQEVNLELRKGLRTKPLFHNGFALFMLNSSYQIHPLVATIWSGKLKKYIVIAANQGYLPGKISFSMRSHADVDLLHLLKDYRLSGEEIGYGHKRASGGIVNVDVFNDFLKRLGF